MPAINPPAALLSESQIDRFELLIETHLFPSGGMSLEAIDGFFSAMFVSPVQQRYEDFVQEVWADADRSALDASTLADIDSALHELWRHVGRRISQPPETLEERAVPFVHLSDAVVEAIQAGTPNDLEAEQEAVGVEWAQGFLHGVSMAAEGWYARMEENEQVEFDLADLIELAQLGEEAEPDGFYDDEEEPEEALELIEDADGDDEVLEPIDIDDFVEQQSRIPLRGQAAESTDHLPEPVARPDAVDGDGSDDAATGDDDYDDDDIDDIDDDEFGDDGDDDPLEPLTVLDCLEFISRAPIMLHDMHLLRMEEARPQPAVRPELPGRNDPCSCGSGKKFKKCCGDPARLH